MSGNKKPKFCKGDKVFAKVRGYPPWPARVEGTADETPNKMRYHVFFYGTGETAIVKGEDICSFVDNKVKLGKPKKPKNFIEALLQIEEDLSPDEKQKLTELKEISKDQSGNSSKNDSFGEDSFKRTSTSYKHKVSTSPIPKGHVKPLKDKKRKHDESLPDEVEKKKSLPSYNSDSDTSNSKLPEVMSRSGRKIKPKRFADYENDSGDENMPATKPISKVAPRMNPDFESEKSAVADDMLYLIAYVNSEKLKIPLDVEKPQQLEVEQEEHWKARVRNYATQLKRRLESGEVLPTSVEDHMYQWGREQARKALLISNRPSSNQENKQEHILTEGLMLEIDLGIRGALNIKNADTSKCIQLLNNLMELKLTPLMLKKHPDVVETIKKVRRYIGNVPVALTEAQEKKFHQDTEVIREKADLIYNKFQSLFHVPNHKSFWEYFENEKDYFYHQTKGMSTEEIINLTEEFF